jgi:hypothetical protein
MKKNHSPWLHQLNKERQNQTLTKDIRTDVAIVGAGIAGISTAYFILKNTNKHVVLVDRFKLAHGATGHNAGQVVSYFERGFASLVDEFGLEMAARDQLNIEQTWQLLDEMYTEAGLSMTFSRFLGHAGLSSFDHVMLHLKNNFFRKKAGLSTERMLVSEDADFISRIPEEYRELYTLAPHKEVLALLETTVLEYCAVLSYPKGCLNSALFCEHIFEFLQKKYGERISLYEHTQIHKILLHEGYATLDAVHHLVICEKVVMCTNGFQNIHIIDNAGLDIDVAFHERVQGTVGYMSAYLEKLSKEPIAISYLQDPHAGTLDPYFYLTRRVYEYEQKKDHNLISIGGPEQSLEDAQTSAQSIPDSRE